MELKRNLGPFDSTMIVMGTIIGIGIFFTPSRVAADMGSHIGTLIVWSVGGLLAMTGAATYSMLGLVLPKTGGPYIYLREGLGRLCAFLYGYALLVAIMTGAIAVIALVFVDHLARFFPMGEAGRLVVASGTILILSLINVAGVVWGSRVQNVFTVLKILSLVGLVVAGLLFGQETIFAESDPVPNSRGVVAGFFSAMVAVMFSFGGWQNLANVAGEMKQPERNLPRAVLVGVFAVGAIYLLANIAYLKLLPLSVLTEAQAPAAIALEMAVGTRAGDITAILILCSAFGILNGLTLSGPRVYYAMARDGLLPGVFGRIHDRYRTPIYSIAVQGIIAVLLLLVFRGSIGRLTDYVVFADWFFFSLNAVALFFIVRRMDVDTTKWRKFGYPWVPVLFGLLSIAVTIGVLIGQWENARFGLLLLASGVPLFVLFSRKKAQ